MLVLGVLCGAISCGGRIATTTRDAGHGAPEAATGTPEAATGTTDAAARDDGQVSADAAHDVEVGADAAPSDAAEPPAEGGGNGLWSVRAGGTEAEYLNGMGGDPDGNLLLTGAYSGKPEFGGNTLPQASQRIYLAKLSGHGSWLWSKTFSTVGVSTAGDQVRSGPDGSIFLAGAYDGGLDLGTGPLPYGGIFGIFLARLSPSGNALWSRGFGSASEAAPEAIAVDPDGSVWMAGYFVGQIDLGNGSLSSQQGNAFVARFDADGNTLFVLQWQDSLGETASDIALDAAGNALVAVNSKPDLVRKLDPAGNEIWTWSFPAGADSAILDRIAVTSDGGAVFAGTFKGTLQVAGASLQSAGDQDVVVVRLDAAGKPLWARAFGGPGIDSPADLVVDASDHAFITGWRSPSPILQPGDILPANIDAFVTEIAADGTIASDHTYGDAVAGQEGTALVVGASGALLLGGNFEGKLDFGNGVLEPAGRDDLFVTRLH